jgi:2-phospho-L-lactate guanylyltransferase
MTIWAIVPVKPLRRGKSRLAGMLTEDQRVRLNHYLLEHILTVLNEVPEIEHTLVVSRDAAALALTRDMGGRTVLEDGAPQFNTALKRASVVAQMHGAHAVLVLPADLPLIDAKEIQALLKHGRKPPVVVIAPDRRENGTNGLFINPVNLIEYAYGPGSNTRHAEQAVLAGARVKVIRSKAFGLDLDLPEDLELIGGLNRLKLD